MSISPASHPLLLKLQEEQLSRRSEFGMKSGACVTLAVLNRGHGKAPVRAGVWGSEAGIPSAVRKCTHEMTSSRPTYTRIICLLFWLTSQWFQTPGGESTNYSSGLFKLSLVLFTGFLMRKTLAEHLLCARHYAKSRRKT